MASIIFDFDGTIANSFAVVVQIMQDLTHRKEVMTAEELEKLRGMNVLGITRELHIRPWRVPMYVAVGRRRMRKHMHEIPIYPGIQGVFQDLSKDHDIYIMSSNSAQNITKFLTQHELNGYFKKIYGNVGLLGKASVLRRIMKQNGIASTDVVYIGDEVRDVEGSKLAGVPVVAVGWGYNNVEVLARHNPDKLVQNMSELSGAIRSLLRSS